MVADVGAKVLESIIIKPIAESDLVKYGLYGFDKYSIHKEGKYKDSSWF